MIRLLWTASAEVRYFLRRYMPSNVLLDLIRTNGRKLVAYYRVAYRYPGAIARSALEHRTLATLITSRRADEAEALMTRHVGFDQVTVMDLLAALA